MTEISYKILCFWFTFSSIFNQYLDYERSKIETINIIFDILLIVWPTIRKTLEDLKNPCYKKWISCKVMNMIWPRVMNVSTFSMFKINLQFFLFWMLFSIVLFDLLWFDVNTTKKMLAWITQIKKSLFGLV